MGMQFTLPPVKITFTRKNYHRPPLVGLFFNITLRNERLEPQWFLLPSKLNHPTELLSGGIDGVEVFRFGGQGRVVVGHFQGTGGFQAVLLPGNAEVTLHDFPIAFWGSLPEDSILVDVVIADQLLIGREAAQTWLGNDFMSDRQADVTSSQQEQLGSRYTPDRSEISVSMIGEHHITQQVDLGS